MSGGPIGFGTGPNDFGPSGIDVPEPVGDSSDQLVDDIHAIRVRVVDNLTNIRIPLLFVTSFAGNRRDMTGQVCNSVIVTATSGVIYGYLFDTSNQFGKNVNEQPDFVVSAGVVPSTQQFMFPPGNNYILCFQEGAGSTAAGSVRIAKI